MGFQTLDNTWGVTQSLPDNHQVTEEAVKGAEKRMQEEQCREASNHELGGEECPQAVAEPPGQLEITLQFTAGPAPRRKPQGCYQ